MLWCGLLSLSDSIILKSLLLWAYKEFEHSWLMQLRARMPRYRAGTARTPRSTENTATRTMSQLSWKQRRFSLHETLIEAIFGSLLNDITVKENLNRKRYTFSLNIATLIFWEAGYLLKVFQLVGCWVITKWQNNCLPGFIANEVFHVEVVFVDGSGC